MSEDSLSPLQEYTPVANTNGKDLIEDASSLEVMASVNGPAKTRNRPEGEEREKSTDSIIALDQDHDRSSPDIPLRRDRDRERDSERDHCSPKETPRRDHRTPQQQPVRQQPMRQAAQQTFHRHAQHQQPMQTSQRPVPRPNTQTTPSTPHHKKPGPKPWSTKPLTKNDIEAKKELIAEIERYWGKGFIKAFIPKCHRPLVKKGKHGKRSAFRQSENDPKKWMPSVLKAVLMIAKKTNDKQWLKEQMRDVVTYRIKHTGNRKPQLVTTDFDVIEDVFDSGWTVAQSFAIRYKHLLMNHTGTEETDEDIAHIFGEGPRQEGSASSGEDGDDGGDDEDDEEEDAGEYGEDRPEDEEQQSLSGGYFQTSGYVLPPQYPLPTKPKQGYGQPHLGVGRQVPRQQPHNNERPSPQNTWAAPPLRRLIQRPRPAPMQQHPTPSPSYAASDDRPYTPGSKRQRSPETYGFGQAKRNRGTNMITSAAPSRQMSRMHVQSATPVPQYPFTHPGVPKIKTEPGLEESFGGDEYNGPVNYLGPLDEDNRYANEEPDELEMLRLELEASEAKARAADLRLRVAEGQRRKAM